MRKIEITTSVANGILNKNRNRIVEAVKSFEGKEVVITIQVKRKKRSNPQNAYYWGVIVPIFQKGIKDNWGENFSIKETHEHLKYRFNSKEKLNKDTGEIINIPKSTTDNSTEDQERYCNDIREFVREWFNVVIPLPNEQIIIEI